MEDMAPLALVGRAGNRPQAGALEGERFRGFLIVANACDEVSIERIERVCYNAGNVGFGRTVSAFGRRTCTTDDVAGSRANHACAG
jgi:hypothetical protein